MFKEHFCPWGSKTKNAMRERDERRNQYYAEEATIRGALENVKTKQDEINVSNNALENSLVKANDKFSKIMSTYEQLIQDYNKTIINSKNCESFNKLKLNAIKKIYS